MTRFFQFQRAPRARLTGLTSVTRWLLVVAGCTGLELVQPALLAEGEQDPASFLAPAPVAPEATAPVGSASAAVPAAATAPSAEPAGFAPDTVLYPTGAEGRVLAGRPLDEPRSSSLWLVSGIVLIGGGVWVWLKRGKLTARVGGRTLIGIEETRSLGNRQFLVVASCDGRRFLLGVSPGRIATLADLDDLPPGDLTGSAGTHA